MHDVLIVSVPLITILAGLFFNRTEMQALRAEVKAELKDLRTELKADIGSSRSEIGSLRSEMNARFDRVDAELRYFHGLTGKLDARVEALEKR